MIAGSYFGQNYFAQGYSGDQSAIVYAFADASETTIGRGTVRKVGTVLVDRTIERVTGVRTIGETT